jgi:hypothetical protein
MNIEINALSVESIEKAIQKIEDYAESLETKAILLCEKLASIGATRVSLEYARAIYTGPSDVNVSVEEISPTEYKVIAAGETVLFVEFGAGVTYGNGHPLDAELGMGPGTYPNQKHAFDPKGWYLPKEKGGGHTFGNPPTMAMYNTGKDLRKEILRIAQEVFKT